MLGTIDALGFLGDALILAGVWMVGDKRITGWYMGLAGVIVSLWYATLIKSLPIILIEIIFIGIYVRNIVLWSKGRNSRT